MPALNQLGRKPEGQEGVRWNLGQGGRKHQEETPAAAVEAKEWAEAQRQIITGRAGAVADVRLSEGGWDGTCEERGFFNYFNYLKKDSFPNPLKHCYSGLVWEETDSTKHLLNMCDIHEKHCC